MADDTPPPIAPPDMVMVRITNGNTSAMAASASVPSRPIYDVSATATQVPAPRATTFGPDSRSKVRRIGWSSKGFPVGAAAGATGIGAISL